MTHRSAHTIQTGKSIWIRFAMQAAERWLNQSGKIPEEMLQLGTYLRELRYRAGYSIDELSTDLDIAYEDLLMLEEGLLKPSEVVPNTWVRLMEQAGFSVEMIPLPPNEGGYGSWLFIGVYRGSNPGGGDGG